MSKIFDLITEWIEFFITIMFLVGAVRLEILIIKILMEVNS